MPQNLVMTNNLKRADEALETGRWTPLRKAAVAEAIRTGEITIKGAEERYSLTAEEIGSWCARYRNGGPKNMRHVAMDADRNRR